MGILPMREGVCWASSRVEFGESGAHGKSNKGKQSQPCHHSNRTAATGSTICFKIGAFPVLLSHLGGFVKSLCMVITMTAG